MTETVKTPLRRRSPNEIIRDRLERARTAVLDEVINRTDEDENEIDLVKPFLVSSQLLGDYVTLDWPHYNSIRIVRWQISKYANDRSRRRPLNIMMHAEPGSGKSHLIKSLAASISHDAVSIDYNMAGLQSIEDLLQPLDSVRNVKVQDKLPILFLDEFDSNASHYPLLLPLMWDGELNIAHRNLKLGKLVIILAGSGDAINRSISVAKGMQAIETFADGKLVDLVSRINGGELEIPPLDLVADGRDRRADKVCLTISLLKSRFGGDLELVPVSLLRFVATTKFRYGVRSLAHLIDLIQPFESNAENTTQLLSKQLTFPLNNVSSLRNSSLAYHVFSEDGPAAIVEHWKIAASDKASVRIQEKVAEEDVPF